MLEPEEVVECMQIISAHIDGVLGILGIFKHELAQYPEMIYREARLASYPNPCLADAGFFGPKPTCFQCGFRLYEDCDDPWAEHAIRQPDCQNLRLHKGQDFIDSHRHNHFVYRRLQRWQPWPMDTEEEEPEPKPKPVDPCSVCLDKAKEVLFLPCRHITTCIECAAVLEECPICRMTVFGIARCYII
jgi:baculoviral IAP repeat-containing protein 7/8